MAEGNWKNTQVLKKSVSMTFTGSDYLSFSTTDLLGVDSAKIISVQGVGGAWNLQITFGRVTGFTQWRFVAKSFGGDYYTGTQDVDVYYTLF